MCRYSLSLWLSNIQSHVNISIGNACIVLTSVPFAHNLTKRRWDEEDGVETLSSQHGAVVEQFWCLVTAWATHVMVENYKTKRFTIEGIEILVFQCSILLCGPRQDPVISKVMAKEQNPSTSWWYFTCTGYCKLSMHN